MKEYESCNINEQVVFNKLLKSARNPIECSFGRLRACWSILKKKIDLKLSSVPTHAYACCVLHNYCERKKITWMNTLSKVKLLQFIATREHNNLFQVQSIHAIRVNVKL